MDQSENSKQLCFWPLDSEMEAASDLLAPSSWIKVHSLSPYVAAHGDPVEIREMMNRGIKPCEVMVIYPGR